MVVVVVSEGAVEVVVVGVMLAVSEVSSEEEVVGAAEAEVEVVAAIVLVVVSAAAVSGVVVVARGDAVAEGVPLVVEALEGAIEVVSESSPPEEHAEMSNVIAMTATTLICVFALKYRIFMILSSETAVQNFREKHKQANCSQQFCEFCYSSKLSGRVCLSVTNAIFIFLFS